MGMWGMGTFANDSALDFLGEVVDEFARRINAVLGVEVRQSEGVEVKPIDQVEVADIDRVVLPSAAILIRLCITTADQSSPKDAQHFTDGLLARIGSPSTHMRLPVANDPFAPDPELNWSATPPASKLVRIWRERALAAFTATVRPELTSADYREERPVLIKMTFDRLEALAAASEEWQG